MKLQLWLGVCSIRTLCCVCPCAAILHLRRRDDMEERRTPESRQMLTSMRIDSPASFIPSTNQRPNQGCVEDKIADEQLLDLYRGLPGRGRRRKASDPEKNFSFLALSIALPLLRR